MASPNPDSDSFSMFMQRGDGTKSRSPTNFKTVSRKNSSVDTVDSISAEVITVKDFFDFMKTAYQVYEHLEGDEDEGSKINWEELTKLTVINHEIEQQERDLLFQTAFNEPKAMTSRSDTVIEKKNSEIDQTEKRYSCSELEGKGHRLPLPEGAKVEMLSGWTEVNLNCKLNDVIKEGILDSILPYLVGYKKQSKTTSVYVPILNKSSTDIKKLSSFGGFVDEKESRDRLGRRKSSVVGSQDRNNQRQDGDVEIHVCDEVKGLNKDFRCSQKLLVSKMGYFADVTAGQRLEDMDISVHCDIQIFDWLMRWVKRDTILVADWPLLDPQNVIPILVSASFLQMEPLLHDCLIYCHAHMNDIVKTTTNLACLSDVLLTRLAAMYTNAELEAIRDRKDKILSRLYCKMILSLAEPVPETLRGHYATLATLFKCNKCNKLLGRHISPQVLCQPTSILIDRRGNVISEHTKDPSWSLNEYIRWLYGELRSWRRVYWRLWADCHFLHCQLCDSFFPAYQMEWCSHHEQSPHMFAVQGAPMAAGRYACCGERAYRFETITRNTGCQFREHVPSERTPSDASTLELYGKFRDIITMRPPQLMFPERLTRLVPREGCQTGARLQCEEVCWWQGVRLAPEREPLGLLGRLYTSEQQFNHDDVSTQRSSSHASSSRGHIIKRHTALARPGSQSSAADAGSQSQTGSSSTAPSTSPDLHTKTKAKEENLSNKQGAGGRGPVSTACEGDSSDESEQTDDSDCSDEDAPHRSPESPALNTGYYTLHHERRDRDGAYRRGRAAGRVWMSTQSARSNQDGQRRFEERAAANMRAVLIRRHHATRTLRNSGGVYARLEAEWRERQGGALVVRSRQAPGARARTNKYK